MFGPGINVGKTGSKGQGTGMKDSEIAYLAGLFDGEGSVMYKQYLEKRKNRPNPSFSWRIRLEVAMTDKDTIKHIYDTLLVGGDLEKLDPDVNLNGVGQRHFVEQTM